MVGGVGVGLPCILSTSKCGRRKRINRASWTVCTVALLPEPWKARRVGFTVPGEEDWGVLIEDMFVVCGVLICAWWG